MADAVTIRSMAGATMTLTKSQAAALAKKIRATLPALSARSECYDDYLFRTLGEWLEAAATRAA